MANRPIKVLFACMVALPAAAFADSSVAAPTAGAEIPADSARGLEDPDPWGAADVALFVPRVVMVVPRAALQVISWPVMGAVRVEEEYHVLSWLEDIFYNDARTAAVIPYASFESFFGPGVGVVAFHDDLFGHREALHLNARFGGREKQSYELSFGAGQVNTVAMKVRFESSDNLLFHGIGADGPESRYAQDRLLAVLRLGHRFGPLGISAAGIYNHRQFGDGTITEQYDTMAIPGYIDGVENLELQGGLNLESKPFRAELFLGGVPTGARYWHWGAEATAEIPLWAEERVLHLRAAAEGVEGDDIPFSDLPRLGGTYRLRGYPLDRFRGTSAYLGTIEYRYPVHQYVAGALFVDAGKVTDNDWKAGGGMGLVVHSKDRALFNFDVAYGEGFQFMVSTDPLRAFAKKDTEL